MLHSSVCQKFGHIEAQSDSTPGSVSSQHQRRRFHRSIRRAACSEMLKSQVSFPLQGSFPIQLMDQWLEVGDELLVDSLRD